MVRNRALPVARPAPPTRRQGPRPPATHLSALLRVFNHAAGGCLGGGNASRLGAGAEVELHCRPWSLSSPSLVLRDLEWPVPCPEAPPCSIPGRMWGSQRAEPSEGLPARLRLERPEAGSSVLGAGLRGPQSKFHLSDYHRTNSQTTQNPQHLKLCWLIAGCFFWRPRSYGSRKGKTQE